MACLESTLDILPSDRVIGNPLASPAALIRLEVLLGSRVVDLREVSELIASDAGLKDDRLLAGAEVKLVIAGNNKTAREVHLPLRKKDK